MSNKVAVNIIDECKREYWSALKSEQPSDDLLRILSRVSLHDLVKLFELAVVPAIDEARRLDRGGEVKERDPRTMSQAAAEFIAKSVDYARKNISESSD